MKGLLPISLLFFALTLPEPIHEVGGSYRGLASSWNIIQSRSLAGLHYIFKGFEINEEEDLVKVSGPVVEITDGEKLGAKVHREGFISEMDPEDFEQEQLLGQSVFAAVSGSGSNVGTAFLVGNNIVLTNRHILSLPPTAKEWSCGVFSVLLNHKEERVACKKVRFCSSRYDFCAVEMHKMKNGNSIGSEVKPLRLTQKVKNNKDISLLHIGNAAGLGIQASRGRGIRIKDGEFYHFAPTLGGSSGAPLFDERGAVVGINWAHTGADYIDDSSFNRGVLSTTIYEELKKTHIYTLREIKSFKAWHRKNAGHRQVTVESRQK